jgi:hypothetical protein
MTAKGKIVVRCPKMDTFRVSSTRRKTSQIQADVEIIMVSPPAYFTGQITFPVCNINKVFGPLWQVEEVTASGMVGDSNVFLSMTLKPEWTFGPLALPVQAFGTFGPYRVKMRYPFVWASLTGPGKWTVAACQANGEVF